MVRSIIRKDLALLLDSYGLDTEQLGNDLLFDLAREIVAKNLVRVPYVTIDGKLDYPLSERPENFIAAGLVQCIDMSLRMPRRILGLELTEENVMDLVTGDNKVLHDGKLKTYPQAIEDLVENLRLEASLMIADYRETDIMYKESTTFARDEDRLKHYQKLMQEDPKHALAKLYAATILSKKGQIQRAEELLNSALQLRPDDPRILNQRGILYRKMGRVDAALWDFERAIQIDPTTTKAIYNLALLHDAKGNKKKSREMLKIAAARGNLGARKKLKDIGTQPSFTPTPSVEELCMQAKETSDRAEKIRLYERAVELDPSSLKAKSNLGVMYMRRGDSELSERILREVLECDPHRQATLDAYNRIHGEYVPR